MKNNELNNPPSFESEVPSHTLTKPEFTLLPEDPRKSLGFGLFEGYASAPLYVLPTENHQDLEMQEHIRNSRK
ncbi:hypothetical protein BH11PAT1_BH11PAT1_4920 [soil metagenome]